MKHVIVGAGLVGMEAAPNLVLGGRLSGGVGIGRAADVPELRD